MTATVHTLSVGDLQSSPRRARRNRLAAALFLAAALTSMAVSAAIVLAIATEAWTFLTTVELSSLTDIGWFPRRGMYDISTLLVGTLLVAGIAMAVATPVGLGAATYLSEYANPRVRSVLKPILEVLASVPSVVLGLFAISFITPNLIQPVAESANFFNVLAAGIAVGFLTIPLVASISEDAMRSVPDSLREASAGLGARKITTTVRVVLPAAVSGIVAACIVGLSRAVGETMVVAIAAGGVGGGLFSTDVLQPGQTLTGAMASLGLGTDQVAGDDLAFQSLYFLGALLFVITFALNLAGEAFVRRVREKY
jgi:phosphate transport system permease protein